VTYNPLLFVIVLMNIEKYTHFKSKGKYVICLLKT